MKNKTLLLAIKPEHVKNITNGTKKYELRRKCPKIITGELALIYESSPTKSLVGAFTIGRILTKAPALLWKKIGAESGLSRALFMNYFENCDVGCAIEIERYCPLVDRVCLNQIRKRAKIEPPQSYLYLCRIKADILVGGIS